MEILSHAFIWFYTLPPVKKYSLILSINKKIEQVTTRDIVHLFKITVKNK